MPQYLTPGVYIEEIPGAKPIEGVGTATGAFVGIAEKGRIGKAELITNWTQFVNKFGSYVTNGYLAYAVNQFFTEGGTKCYVVRTCHYNEITKGTPSAEKASITLKDRSIGIGTNILTVTALSEGSWGNHIGILIEDSSDKPEIYFKLAVLYKGSVVEAYDNLTVDAAITKVNADSKYIKLEKDSTNRNDAPTNRPKVSCLQFWDQVTPQYVYFPDNKETFSEFYYEKKFKDVGNLDSLGVTALQEGIKVSIRHPPNLGITDKFNLVIKDANEKEESIDDLTMTSVEKSVNNKSSKLYPFIRVARLSENRPNITTDKIGVQSFEPLIYSGIRVYPMDQDLKLQITDSGNNKFKLSIKKGEGQPIEIDGLAMSDVEDEKLAKQALGYISVERLGKELDVPKTIAQEDLGNPMSLSIKPLKTNLSVELTRTSEQNKFVLVVFQNEKNKVTEIERKLISWINVLPELSSVELIKTGSQFPPATTIGPVELPCPWKLFITPLARGLTATIKPDKPEISQKFSLTIQKDSEQLLDIPNLSLSDVERKINRVSKYILVKASVGEWAPTNMDTQVLDGYFGLSGGWNGLFGKLFKDPNGNGVISISPLQTDKAPTVSITDGIEADQFTITVTCDRDKEIYPDLKLETVEGKVNDVSQYIEIHSVDGGANRPETTDYTFNKPEDFGLWDADFIGDEGAQNGLHAFDVVDDINILAIPDRPGDREVILAAAAYCKNRKDCFFVADPPMGLTPQVAKQFKEGTGDYPGNAFNSSFAALYYPWIKVSDPLTGKTKLVPPSGAVVGTYSYTDVARGVHKAPAGISEGYLDSAVGIEYLVTKGEQELLNPIGVNVIRSFPGSGIVIWGARTLSADAEWKYVNVRRLLLFIEESIDKGSQWVVFEPNDRSLWASVKRDVTAFLTTVWRSGALFGSTAQEAFFVKIDDENNPPESRDLGRLIIDVGVAPVKPAEFVIFRVSQITQGSKG